MPVSFQSSAFNYDVNGPRIDVQTFRVSGIWSKPAGAKFVQICAWGGGGGGAGGVLWGNAGSSVPATGGGGGARVQYLMPADFLPNQVIVTVGAGGAGGIANNQNAFGTDGNVGGTTSFGNVVTAYGGGGGYKALNSWLSTILCSIAGGTGGGSAGPGQTPTLRTCGQHPYRCGFAGGLPANRGLGFGGGDQSDTAYCISLPNCLQNRSNGKNFSISNNIGTGGGGFPRSGGGPNGSSQICNISGGSSEWGGGAGGGGIMYNGAVYAGGGGSSTYGPGGGGAGGFWNTGVVNKLGAAGGTWCRKANNISTTATGGQLGAAGANGITQVTGSGSGGSGGNGATLGCGVGAGGRGGDGGFPGGGGGGGGSTSTGSSFPSPPGYWTGNAGNGGKGGDGYVVVYTW